jgi:hypothetical protein
VWFVDARGCFAGATACAAVGAGVPGAARVVVLPVAAAVAVAVAAVLAAALARRNITGWLARMNAVGPVVLFLEAPPHPQSPHDTTPRAIPVGAAAF